MTRQEQTFSYRIADILEPQGFTVAFVPESPFRTQLIDSFVIRNGYVWPCEFKGKDSKNHPKRNRLQLEMQMAEFQKSNTPFFKVEQGNRKGQFYLVAFNLGVDQSRLWELHRALGKNCIVRAPKEYETNLQTPFSKKPLV